MYSSPNLLLLLALALALALPPPVHADTPIITDDMNSGEDHRAHAVPGGPYTFFDHTGDDAAAVEMDGSRSHSHYYNHIENIRGRIVAYRWSLQRSVNNTGTFRFDLASSLLCTHVICRTSLPLGDHIVQLSVTDNTGDVANSTTRVSVRDGGRPGARLLFYPGIDNLPVDPNWRQSADYKPTLSRTPKNLALWGRSAFPAPILRLKTSFSIRALFDLDITNKGRYSFRLDCGTAICWMRIGGKVLIPWKSGARSRSLPLSADSHPVEILWRRKFTSKDSNDVRLVLQWLQPGTDWKKLSHTTIPAPYIGHRPGDIPPVIHFINPRSAEADTTLKLFGSSFIAGTRVYIGNDECLDPKPSGQYYMTCEITGTGGVKNVSAINRAGTSNSNVPLTVEADSDGIGYSQQIKFNESVIQDGKKNWKLSSATSVALGPDGRYYFGTQWGSVVSVVISGNRMVSSCASRQMDNRSILDVKFNPHEGGKIRIYSTVCTLFWLAKKRLPQKTGWRNGEVWTFEPRKDKPECMAPVKAIISGLPVSNYDHGVNKLLFDDYGNLYITVGSNTNGGVPSDEFGNLPDTKLSGAVLIAPLTKKGFNGHLKWDRDADKLRDIARANVVSGDVKPYAVGLRNSFGMELHSSGRIYATDNGGNQAFGRWSTGCDADTRPRNEDDKVLLLKEGAWYGSANRARGLFGRDGKQCIHKRPGIDTKGYELPLKLTEPATTGIMEYTANTFGGRLRGDLLLSQLATAESDGRMYRARLNSTTGDVRRLYTLLRFTGLAMALGPHGDIVMPRVYRQQVVVLRAVETNPGRKVVVVTKVNPLRGPKGGRHPVTISGWNFGSDASKISVMFDGKQACTNVRNISKYGRSLVCDVPPLVGDGPRRVPVVVSVNGKSSVSAGFEYWYMAI